MKGLKKIEPAETAHLLEGLRFALHSVGTAFNRIQCNVKAIEVGVLPESKEQIIESFFIILSDCWSIIDHINRCSELVKSLKISGSKSAERKNLLFEAEKVRDFRNVFQHLGARAKNIPTSGQPIMGSLCWIASNGAPKCHTILLASGAVNAQYHSLTYDRQDRQFLGDFLFQAAGKEAYLKRLAEVAELYFQYLETTLSSLGAHSSDTVQALAISLEVPISDFLPETGEV